MTTLQSLENLTNWDEYLEFLRADLKKLDGPGEIYVTKDKVEYTIKGKPWRGFAVLPGTPKAIAALPKLKKEGLKFLIGTCKPDGKTLQIEGLPKLQLKGAHLLFKKLKIGYKIAGPGGEELEGEEGAEDGAGGADGEGRFQDAWKRIAAEWAQATSAVDGQVAQLRSALKSSGDADLAKIADGGLTGFTQSVTRPLAEAMKQVETATGPALAGAIASARKALADFANHVRNDQRIAACDQNPFGVAVKIRETLVPVLAKMQQALASAPSGN